MTVEFHCRIEKALLEKANRVARRHGTSIHDIVRILVSEMASTGKTPISLDASEDGSVAAPWTRRAKVLESFYYKSKTW